MSNQQDQQQHGFDSADAVAILTLADALGSAVDVFREALAGRLPSLDRAQRALILCDLAARHKDLIESADALLAGMGDSAEEESALVLGAAGYGDFTAEALAQIDGHFRGQEVQP